MKHVKLILTRCSAGNRTAMDALLAGAAEMSVCKLACSLLMVPWMSSPNSPVSFCCCCLLLFTDFLVAVYLNILWISGSWWTALTPADDVIALRFLLFQGHTYSAVLFLTVPLTAAETLTRRLWPRFGVDSHGPHCCTGSVNTKEGEEEGEEGRNKVREERLSPAVSYLCCLSVWVGVALNVRWRWGFQEEWTAQCLSETNSFVGCLPKVFHPVPSATSPLWGSAFMLLLLVLLTTNTSLQRMTAKETLWTKHRRNCDRDTGQDGFTPTCPAPSQPVSAETPESARRVDPEKTESSCNVPRTCSGNSVQMLAHHHGDFVLISQGCLSAEKGGRQLQKTKGGLPLTFIREGRKDSQCERRFWQRRRGFPCLWARVIIGLAAALSIFVLPTNLSVTIVLIREIDAVLEMGMAFLVHSVVNTSAAPAFSVGTFV